MNLLNFTILIYILIGYFLGRRFPFCYETVIRFWYGIKSIPYWKVYFVEGGKIIDDKIVKKSKDFVSRGDKKYYMYHNVDEDSVSADDKINEVIGDKKKDGVKKKIKYTPHIILDGLESVFFNTNNLNPLVFNEDGIVPSYNNPALYASMIMDAKQSNLISDNSQLIAEFKRYVTLVMIVLALAVAGIMWLLQNNFIGG